MDQSKVLKRLAQITSEAEALGPYLEGDLLQNKKATYTKRDGTVSTYATAPVLQYRAGEGGRRSKRIPADKVEAVQRLLEVGRRRRALMVEHRELAAKLALDFNTRA